MRSLFAVCLVLVCFVDKSYGTFAEFMNNLPSEVASAFSSAWSSITDALKKPVRIKRLGPGGKIKSSTAPPTTSNPLYPVPSIIITRTPSRGSTMQRQHSKTMSYLLNPAFPTTIRFTPTTATPSSRKLTLPVLPLPNYKAFENWRNMQKVLRAERKEVSHPAPILVTVDASPDKRQSFSRYDNNSFATLIYIK